MPAPLSHEALARAARAAFGADVEVAGVDALTGAASSRRYVRLTLRGRRAPHTAVAMVLGVEQRFGPGADEFAGPIEDTELPFLNVARYLARHGFAVPAIYHDASAGDAIVLLEDVGDTSLWAAASAAPTEAPSLFASAVDVLVALQVAGSRDPDPTCRAFRQR